MKDLLLIFLLFSLFIQFAKLVILL